MDDGAMNSVFCRVYEAKEYLLHAQNALLVAMLGSERQNHVIGSLE